jgi:soluble lytic murein transglycosylase-like protein
MTKIPPAILLLIVASVSALAQNPSYSIDNFDFQNGVRIYQAPPKAPSGTSKLLPRTRSRSTRKSYAINANAVLAPSLASSALIQPTLMSNSPRVDLSTLRGYTTGNTQVDGYLIDSGTRHGVDPLLLYSVMHQESSFKSHAVSPKGARGLMQLMPGTAIRFGVTNIFDPKQNIEGGARYLRFLTDRFNGDVSLVLAGYNAGEGAVEKYGWRIPPYAETQEYVRRISRRYSLIQDPNSALYARTLNSRQVAGLQAKESSPLSLYERTVSTVRMPDGRLQLMSQ